MTDWQPSQRYPDPAIEILHPSFSRIRVLGRIERIATGMRWAEGPVWFADHRCLYWSDIPNDRIMRWDEESGAVSVFRKPSHHANGNTRDRQGRLVTCEHGARRVTRTEYDGRITVLAERFEGKRLNSPNDVVVRSDDSVWFTDPPFGLLGDYEGERAPSERPESVYRFDPRSGRLDVLETEISGPNGLCFSPDETKLYLVESRREPRLIHVYDVVADGTRLANRRVFVDAEDGTPDGFRCDEAGNLWCGWGMGNAALDGVRVFSPAGEPVLRIGLPERCANLCFGGKRRNRLFMASSQSVYSLFVNTRGAEGG